MSHLRRTGANPVASLTATLLGGLAVLTQAQVARTVQDGVFTEAQAARGQAAYVQRCASCHGADLNGGQAPPLVGKGFTDKWRTEPLSGLFIKIRHTMPPAAPSRLTSELAVDLVAHVLKSNGFPAGKAELAAADAPTSDIGWPALRALDDVSGKSTRSYPPVGTLAQLMRSVFFPNSNLIFTVQTRDPAAPVPPPKPAVPGASFSTFEWGLGIYTGWPVVENAAAALADNSPLMLTPGLVCENGRAAPVTEADWIKFTDQMIVVAKRTFRLAQTRNQEAVSEATGDLSEACGACHRVYRDVPRSGAERPNPANNAARCLHR